MGKTADDGLSLDALNTGLNFDEVSFFNEELPVEAPVVTPVTPVAITTPVTPTDPAEVAVINEEDDEPAIVAPVIPTVVIPVAPVTDPSPINMKIVADVLKERGIIEFDDAAFDKAEDKDEFILTSVAERITDGIQEYKDTLPKEIQDLVDLHEQGVPLYTALQSDAVIDYYEKIDKDSLKEDVSMQKDIIRDLLIKQGNTEDKANKKIKTYETTGILDSEAEDALDSLVEFSKTEKTQRINAEKQKTIAEENRREAQVTALKQTIKDTKEIIPTIEATPIQRKQLEEAILRFDKDGLNKIMRIKKANPMFDLQVAYIAAVYDGDFTKFAEAVKTKAVTKATRSLKDAIDSDDKFKTGQGGVLTDNAPKVDLMKKIMKSMRNKK